MGAGMTSVGAQLSGLYFDPSAFGGPEVYVPGSVPDPTCTSPNLSGFLTTSPTPAASPNATPTRRPMLRPISTACDVLMCTILCSYSDLGSSATQIADDVINPDIV